jgi:hypothetical protein
MEMPQLIVMQQALLRYYGNAIECIGNLICNNIYKYMLEVYKEQNFETNLRTCVRNL